MKKYERKNVERRRKRCTMSRTQRKIRILVKRRRDLQYWEKKKENKALGNNPIFPTEFTGVIRMTSFQGRRFKVCSFLAMASWDIGTGLIEVPGVQCKKMQPSSL